MSGGLAISLATRGRVCCKRGNAVIDTLVPTINVGSLEPSVSTEGKKPPEFNVIVPELVPEQTAKGAEVPTFEISPVVEQVPSADTKKDSNTPEVKIRPVIDLRPTIVNKDGD